MTPQDARPPAKNSRHHYVLVHRVLRDAYLENPGAFVKALGQPELRNAVLQALWTRVCARCEGQGPAGFGVEDLEVATLQACGRRAVLLILPGPVNPAEAHFVLAVEPSPAPAANRPPPGYYTLERGRDCEGHPSTFLCAWQRDCHANYGPGPKPGVGAFVLAVERLLSR